MSGPPAIAAIGTWSSWTACSSSR